MSNNDGVVRLSVDASGVEAGIERAKRSNAAYTASVEAMAQRTKAAQDAITEAVTNGSNASTRQINSFIQSLSKQADAAGKTRSELLQLQAAQMGVASSAQPFIDKIKAAEDAMIGGAHAADGLNFSTVGARRELLVLAHEASQGNWSKFGGSLMVLGERVDAMSMIFSATGVTVGLMAAGLAAFAIAAVKGAEEAKQFNAALVLTSNYAGMTASSLQDMTQRVSGATNTSLGDARDTLMSFAKSGQYTSSEMENLANVVVRTSQISGVALEDVIKDYEKLAEDPAKWAYEHNKSMHFMDTATYQHITALQEAGDKHGAVQAIIEAATAQVESSSKTHLSAAAEAWKKLKDGVNEFWASLKQGLSTGPTLQNKIDTLLNEKNDIKDYPFAARRIAAIDQQVALLQEQERLEQRSADLQSKTDQTHEAGIEAARNIDKMRDQLMSNAQRRQKELEKLNKDRAAMQADGVGMTDAEYEGLVAGINDKYKDKKDNGAQAQNELNGKLTALQQQYKLQEDALRTNIDHIKSLHQQGVIDAQTALQKEHDARADAYQKELAIVQQEEELAKGKKQLSALQKYQGEEALLRQKMLDNDKKLSDDQQALREKELRNVAAYRESLNKILITRDDAIAGQISGMSQGTAQRDETKRLEQARKEYDQKFSELTKSRTENKIDTTQYDAELAVLQNFYDARVKQELDATSKIKAAEADWTNGAKSSIANYLDSANKVASQVGNAFTTAFKGMEDAFTTFVTTGKLSFSKMADSIIADLARIAIRSSITGPLASALGSMFGGLSGYAVGTGSGGMVAASSSADSASLVGSINFGGARASGGPTDPNSMYQVNERGPELYSYGGKTYLMSGAQGGYVTPVTGTSDVSSGIRSSGGSMPSMQINLINQSNQPVQAQQGNTQFDSNKYVTDIILTDLKYNGPVARSIKNLS